MAGPSVTQDDLFRLLGVKVAELDYWQRRYLLLEQEITILNEATLLKSDASDNAVG